MTIFRAWWAIRAPMPIRWARMVAGRGPCVLPAGQAPGGAGEVVRQAGEGQPRGVSAEGSGGQVRQRPVDDLCEALLDDRVAAVLRLGLYQQVPGVGEQGVVAPEREQFILADLGFRVEPLDPPHDQPGGGLLLGASEGGIGGLGDLRLGDPPTLVLVEDGVRVLDVDPESSLMVAIAAPMALVIGTVTENRTRARRQVEISLAA
jgi:hypothetical protein